MDHRRKKAVCQVSEQVEPFEQDRIIISTYFMDSSSSDGPVVSVSLFLSSKYTIKSTNLTQFINKWRMKYYQ